MKKFAHWTPDEDQQLRELAGAGLTVVEIAARLDRTRGGVKWRAAQLGLEIRPVGSWTAEQDEVLRRECGRLPTARIALLVGHTENAVGQRARTLGLRHTRTWPADQVELVRREYPTGDPADIARRVGRSVYAVYGLAKKLRLHARNYAPPLPPATVARVRRLHGRGETDLAIGAATGLDRRTVNAVRHRLGLPANLDPTARRRSIAGQRKTLGISSSAELRDRAFRRFAVESGWPEDCRPREVQILNALVAGDRPMTRLELARAIGMRTDRRDRLGRPALLSGNGPGGNYTATLIRRGLIHAVARYQSGGRGKVGRQPSVYLLTPAAIEMRARWQAQQPVEKTHVGTAVPQPQPGTPTDARPGARRLDPVPA